MSTGEQNLLESLKNYAKLQEYMFTMSETKAAFAERTKRPLKNIFYRYMEQNEYQHTQKLTQFIKTLNLITNFLTDLIPKNVKNSDFLSIL